MFGVTFDERSAGGFTQQPASSLFGGPSIPTEFGHSTLQEPSCSGDGFNKSASTSSSSLQWPLNSEETVEYAKRNESVRFGPHLCQSSLAIEPVVTRISKSLLQVGSEMESKLVKFLSNGAVRLQLDVLGRASALEHLLSPTEKVADPILLDTQGKPINVASSEPSTASEIRITASDLIKIIPEISDGSLCDQLIKFCEMMKEQLKSESDAVIFNVSDYKMNMDLDSLFQTSVNCGFRPTSLAIVILGAILEIFMLESCRAIFLDSGPCSCDEAKSLIAKDKELAQVWTNLGMIAVRPHKQTQTPHKLGFGTTHQAESAHPIQLQNSPFSFSL